MTDLLHPGLRIVDGPVIAGLGPGDAISVVADHLVLLRNMGKVPSITSSRSEFAFHDSLRFHDRQWQRSAAMDDWVPVDTRQITCGPWTLQLVDDVGLLGTVRQSGSFVAVRPTRVWDSELLGPASHWTSVHDHEGRVALGEYFVVDGVTHERRNELQRQPRTRGVAVADLADAADGGRVDPAIARAITDQFTIPQGWPIVCFDGAVRRIATVDRPGRSFTNPQQAWELLTDQPWSAAPPPASRAEVAAFVRAHSPVEWTLEKALLEECGLLASVQL